MNDSRFAYHVSRFSWLLLILLPLVLLAPLVFGGRVLYWGVPLMQFYPWQHFAVETLRMGEAPLWNPLVGNGAPLAANLQTGAFYPLNVLYLILPTEVAMGWTAVLHVILAGLFMFAFMRSLGLRSYPALIAAIAYQLSGFFIARLGFLSITATFPWVAAWLWRAERVLQFGHGREAFWLAVAVGLGLLAGHAQTALYGMILLATYVLYRGFGARRDGERRGIGIIWVITGVLIGIGLASIQLLPAAELARESQRAGGLDYAFAMTHSYWPWRLLTLLSPDLFGNPAYGNFWGYDNYWENAAYIGLLPFVLVGAALRWWWTTRRSNLHPPTSNFQPPPSTLQPPASNLQRLTPFFTITAMISLVLAFGWFTPIYPFLFRVMPGFSLFQGPARWLGVFTIALCALSGIGAQSLSGPGSLRRTAKWIVIGIALTGAGVASRGFLIDRTATFPDATLRLGLFTAVGGLMFGLRPSDNDRRFTAWGITFAFVVALDLLTAHAGLNPTIDPGLYHLLSSSTSAIHADGEGRIFMFDADDEAIRKQFGIAVPFASFGSGTLDEWMSFRQTMIANTTLIDGVASSVNFDSLLVGRFSQLNDAINAQSLAAALRLLSLMHVRYIASPRALDLPVVIRMPAVTIYRNEAALPRAWIVPSARVASDPLAAILDPAFDPRSVVILERSLETGEPAAPASHFTLQFLSDTPNTVTIHAASDGSGYLVLADTAYPGWRATVDGQAVDVLRANAALRAVAFPAGEHTVQFRYEPDSVQWGLRLSVASAVIVAAGLAFSMRRRG